MKILSICSLGILLAVGNVEAQTCPGSVVFNNSTLPGLVLPTRDSAFSFTMSTDSGTRIINIDSVSTILTVEAPDEPIGTPEIIINPTVVISSTGAGYFISNTLVCGVIDVSAKTNTINGLSPMLSRNSFLVYPTVSTGMVTVTGSQVDLGNADMLVVDQEGRIVYHLHNNGATTVNLYLGNLSNGLYFLRVNNGNGFIRTQKIIIGR